MITRHVHGEADKASVAQVSSYLHQLIEPERWITGRLESVDHLTSFYEGLQRSEFIESRAQQVREVKICWVGQLPPVGSPARAALCGVLNMVTNARDIRILFFPPDLLDVEEVSYDVAEGPTDGTSLFWLSHMQHLEKLVVPASLMYCMGGAPCSALVDLTLFVRPSQEPHIYFRLYHIFGCQLSRLRELHIRREFGPDDDYPWRASPVRILRCFCIPTLQSLTITDHVLPVSVLIRCVHF